MSILELNYSEPYLIENNHSESGSNASEIFSLRDFVYNVLCSLYVEKDIFYAILDSEKQETQIKFGRIKFTHKYIVIIELIGSFHKLKSAIKKDISILTEDNGKIVAYWFEGEDLNSNLYLKINQTIMLLQPIQLT
jgi:tRNA G10  N-methylase Trm11